MAGCAGAPLRFPLSLGGGVDGGSGDGALRTFLAGGFPLAFVLGFGFGFGSARFRLRLVFGGFGMARWIQSRSAAYLHLATGTLCMTGKLTSNEPICVALCIVTDGFNTLHKAVSYTEDFEVQQDEPR